MVAVDVIFAVSGTISGIILMMARFDLNLIEYEQAASVSKASPINVFRYITLPLTKWGALSAGIL
jgi:ABC-type glycerol-3-phosphate transport system permease component